MKKVITDYFDNIVNRLPDKVVFLENNDNKITYSEFRNKARSNASFIAKEGIFRKPIAIFIDKSINTLIGMFSSLYSGNYYTVIDTHSPKNRIELILDTLKPEIILTDNKNIELLKSYEFDVKVMNIDDINNNISESVLTEINKKLISTDPAYVLFTSGSTGVPKGSVINHSSLISYVSWFMETFDINENTTFGSQTPFYFSMSVSDVYSTIMSGATLCIIPKINFSFPLNLIKYMNEYKINVIYWVPSALSIVANMNTFDYIIPEYLEKVLFAGEVMPMPVLNKWRRALPKLMYANLFGPTETTDICSYYIVDREFNDSDTLPIGIPCNNCDIIIVNEDNKEAKEDEIGELYVRGSFVGSGYYSNSEKTKQAFVQNPLNDKYPEIVYKTGDIGKYNGRGEIEYLGRKDYQIKHMGYRIELGEIESNFNALDGIKICACIYDDANSRIVLFYESDKLENEDVIKFGIEKLLNYMRPNEYIKIKNMPRNANGKIDRKELKNMYMEKEI